MKKLNVKELQNLKIEDIIKKYFSKNILNKFLLYVIKDCKNFYNNKNYIKVLDAQNEIIKLLENLSIGKIINREELHSASIAAVYASIDAYVSSAAFVASAAVSVAKAIAHINTNEKAAADAAALAANAAAKASVRAAYQSFERKQQEYVHYLITLILEENKINSHNYSLLFLRK